MCQSVQVIIIQVNGNGKPEPLLKLQSFLMIFQVRLTSCSSRRRECDINHSRNNSTLFSVSFFRHDSVPNRFNSVSILSLKSPAQPTTPFFRWTTRLILKQGRHPGGRYNILQHLIIKYKPRQNI